MAYYSLGLLAPGAHGPLSLIAYLAFDTAVVGVDCLSLYRGWRESPLSIETRRRMLLTFLGIGTAIEVAASPNWLRVHCVSAPGILLIVWSLLHQKRTAFCTDGMYPLCVILTELWERMK